MLRRIKRFLKPPQPAGEKVHITQCIIRPLLVASSNSVPYVCGLSFKIGVLTTTVQLHFDFGSA